MRHDLRETKFDSLDGWVSLMHRPKLYTYRQGWWTRLMDRFKDWRYAWIEGQKTSSE